MSRKGKQREKRRENYNIFIVKRAEDDGKRRAAKEKAAEQFTDNWKDSQRKIAEVIALLEECGETFRVETYSSDELIDKWDEYYVKGKMPENLSDDEIEKVNRMLAKKGANMRLERAEPVKDTGALRLAQALDEFFG